MSKTRSLGLVIAFRVGSHPCMHAGQGLVSLVRMHRGLSAHKPHVIKLHVPAGWDKGQVPDNMLRFILLVNVTSSAFPSHNTVITVKACRHPSRHRQFWALA